MKILFVTKTIDFFVPLGTASISAIARQKGHHVQLVIIDREDVLNKIRLWSPDIVAYSSLTGEHKYYLELNKKIKKEFDVFTIMGGPHATFYPECIKNSTLDAICIGEGESAFADLLDSIGTGKDVSSIRNIKTHKNGADGIRPLIHDLDSLPFPDRDLFLQNTELGDFPIKTFMASRGCPYPCTYCFNHAYRLLYQGKGKTVRKHSVDYVIDEILTIKGKYPLEFVKFYDDIFVHKVDEWFEEFVRQYKKRVSLPFHCLIRANLATEDMFKLLKETGCYSISMSIEAGDPHFRNELLKRNMSDEDITKAFDLSHRYGIKTFSNGILGLPFSKIEHDIKTVDLTLRCKATFAEFPVFHPYPRTELGNYCIEQGVFNADYENFPISYQNRSPLNCFTEKEKDIQKNLSELGLLALLFPSLWGIIRNYLIYLPSNKLFFLVYYFLKVYMIKMKIYPFRVRLRNFWKLFEKSLALEASKHTDEHFVKQAERKEFKA